MSREKNEWITIHPRMAAGVKWVDCSYTSRIGTIVSKWKRGPGETTLTVVVPANASAVVWVPAGIGEEVISDAPAVRVRVESGKTIYRVASGTYKFVVNRNKRS